MMRKETLFFIVLKRLMGILLATSFAWLSFDGTEAATITPVDDGVVRDGLDAPKDGNPDAVLNGTVIQALNVERPFGSFEDRGIIEFDISGSFDVPTTLNLPVFRSMGPFPFIIDVYTYAGNGAVALDDFNADTLFTSFFYAGQPKVTLDVTSAIQEFKFIGENFMGFNFRFALPSTIPSNGPFVAFNSLEFGPPATLQPIPLPAGLALLLPALALLGIVSTGLRPRCLIPRLIVRPNRRKPERSHEGRTRNRVRSKLVRKPTSGRTTFQGADHIFCARCIVLRSVA